MWWSRRFIELLESFGVGSRLQRGRTYARAGQVFDLEIGPGWVTAKVQGSRRAAYKVRVGVHRLSEEQWDQAEEAMASQALPLASLLAGEMPADIEEVFEAGGVALFPGSSGEIGAECNCPDWANPCKHIAATYYILAEQFDDDPFQIFAWRGRGRDELLAGLRARRGGGGEGAASEDAGDGGVDPQRVTDSASFWHAGPDLADFEASPVAGDAPDALLRQLGPLELGDDRVDLVEILGPTYSYLAESVEAVAGSLNSSAGPAEE